MKNIYETRQRAQELLNEAIAIWRQGAQSERLEGLENDPVMSLLMSAIAYQANETDSNIEMLKTEVVDEFVHMLTPYPLGHAMPATAVISAQLQDHITEWEVNSDAVFLLAGKGFRFMPVLHTRVVNAQVSSVVRVDGRRWKVTLDFAGPVSSLEGFTFAIHSLNFADVSVSCNGRELPIIRPWEYARMPLADNFSIDTMLYNGVQVYDASMVGMDLFARQNIKMYCVDEHDASLLADKETDHLELIFEFTGIGDEFVFNKRMLSLNCIVLADAQRESVVLSDARPIARVAGYDEVDRTNAGSTQFMHLVRPSDSQIYSRARIEVRRVAADRFNQGALIRLLNALITKYHTDFYAFQNNEELARDNTMHRLQDILSHMMEACRKDSQLSMRGVYLMLHHDIKDSLTGTTSVSVSYLTTHGASVNAALNEDSTFILPGAFKAEQCRQIASPVNGSNEVSDQVCETSIMPYQLITNNRIVTPADIKAFCYKELMSRYGFDAKMVRNVKVSHQMQDDPTGPGYEILVEIDLISNNYIRRSFTDKLGQAEILMQRMIEVRSTGIYPVRVKMTITS